MSTGIIGNGGRVRGSIIVTNGGCATSALRASTGTSGACAAAAVPKLTIGQMAVILSGNEANAFGIVKRDGKVA